jgi:hypothetical protein
LDANIYVNLHVIFSLFFFDFNKNGYQSINVNESALGSTQPPIQWVPGALSSGVKRLEHEANHSPPSSVEVNKEGAIPQHPHTSSWRRA